MMHLNRLSSKTINYKYIVNQKYNENTLLKSCFLHWLCRDPSVLDECGLDEKTKDILLDNIKQKMMSQAVKIRSDVEVSCYAYEGIEAVKKALRAGLECSTNDMPVKINLIAPPLYGNNQITCRKYV